MLSAPDRNQRSGDISLSARLRLIHLAGVLALTVVSGVAWHSIEVQSEASTRLTRISQGQRYLQDADMLHDGLMAVVNASFLAAEINLESLSQKHLNTAENGARFRADLNQLEALDLPASLREHWSPLRAQMEGYIDKAEQIEQLATRDRQAALALIPEFRKQFGQLATTMEQATEKLALALKEAEEISSSAAERAQSWIISAGLLAAALTWLAVEGVSRSVRSSLQQVKQVASAMAEGNLVIRHQVGTSDEIGELARVFNAMADSLQGLIERLRMDAERDTFRTHLVEALEMADNEPDAHKVVARAMVEIDRELPMELLLADSSRSNLERAATHPLAGAPGCRVESPFQCVAVRRGNPVVFPNSEALNACNQLRGRACGAVSAVCVPVSFMGRSLGTLHVTGAVLAPPTAEQLAQLTTLGIQAGARIGTVRAFQRSQTRANTDALTGLMNRRSLEDYIRGITALGMPYTLVVADLDHFKSLNDTHGHEAGDRALRLFAEVVRSTLRESDKAARWGGEEFTLVLPHCNAAQALLVCERLRTELASAVASAKTHKFTCSFGIADTEAADNLEVLLRRADDALYVSKREGRDRASIAPNPKVADPEGVRVSEQDSAVNLRLVAQEI